MSTREKERSFDELTETLRQAFAGLSPQCQTATGFLLDHPDEVAVSSMRTIAARADVQPATLVRLTQSLGFSGWQEVRRVFRWQEVRRVFIQRLRSRPEGKNVVVTSGTNTAQKIAILNKEMDPRMLVLNGNDHAESFLFVQNDRATAFAEDDILLAGLAASSRTPEAFNLIAIDGMLADPYALMLRRDDPQFKTAVDAALRDYFASGELQRTYEKWFVRPIPPRNIMLNFPMSEQLKRVIAKPTDSGHPQTYK